MSLFYYCVFIMFLIRRFDNLIIDIKFMYVILDVILITVIY